MSLEVFRFLLCKSPYFLNCNLHIIINVQTMITAHSGLGIPFQNKKSRSSTWQGQEIEVPTGQAIPHTLATLQLQRYQDTSLRSSIEWQRMTGPVRSDPIKHGIHRGQKTIFLSAGTKDQHKTHCNHQNSNVQCVGTSYLNDRMYLWIKESRHIPRKLWYRLLIRIAHLRGLIQQMRTQHYMESLQGQTIFNKNVVCGITTLSSPKPRSS